MNNWFEVKVKYTKQQEDGSFKRVTEGYLLAAMTFSDAETRIYEELGSQIRGEFIVTGIKRENYQDIFAYNDADVWYKTTISFQAENEEGGKSKAVKHNFLVTASSVKEATERINESLKGMMIDYTVKGTVESAIIDVFPFVSDDSEVQNPIEKAFGEHVTVTAMN